VTAVLPAWYLADSLPIDVCACQYGPCGNCGQLDRHERCPKATGFDRGPSPETYLTGRRTGAALAPVWVGRPCHWVCPCDCLTPRVGQLELFEVAG
jgi:hypothetical protein